jgi:membrane-associated phospholipid phosphatase
MYWQRVQLNSRFKSTGYIWLFFLWMTFVWTLFGDVAHVKEVSEQHWVIQHHHLLKMINDESMYIFYILFICLAVWSKIKQHVPLYYLSTGYLIAQLLGSALMVRILKIATGHARPETLIDALSAQSDVWIGYSMNAKYNGFPSGHTSDYFVSAIFLSLCLPKLWMRGLVFAFAAFNGYLRVAQAKHFPLDVFGGVLLAGLSTYFVWRFWVMPHLIKKEQMTA